jgi:4-hydroxy-tetrahydrodipicolinate synthase
MLISGSLPALITPMRDDAVDEKAFQSLVEWQIEQGSHGLVPVGTTGESPTLTHAEHERVIELCIEAAAGRVPVVAGSGSNNTAEAVSLTKFAERAGANAALQVMPYYNKPTQEGLYQHFQKIHDETDIPLIIYNIPGRSVVNMSVETMTRLSELPRIIGVKDSTADLTRVSKQRLAMGPDFIQMSGEDATALALRAHGGHGCISVTANVAPALCARFQDACGQGNYAGALEIQDQLMPLHDALFVEASPGPVKFAASVLGLCSSELRLPLVEPQESTRKLVIEALEHAGLLNSADGHNSAAAE